MHELGILKMEEKAHIFACKEGGGDAISIDCKGARDAQVIHRPAGSERQGLPQDNHNSLLQRDQKNG
jgi:hypothetical protein